MGGMNSNFWSVVSGAVTPASSSWDIAVPSGKLIKSLGVKEDEVIGSDIATNGGFENFTYDSEITNWDWEWVSDFNGKLLQSTDADTGTYAVRIEAQIFPTTMFVAQTLTGLDADPATYQATARVKGTGTFFFVLLDDDLDNWQYAYNFTTDTWDNLGGNDENLTSNHYDSKVITTSYATYTSEAAVTPTSGKITPCFGLDGSGSEYVLIDNATFYKVGVGTDLLTDPGFETWTADSKIFADDFLLFADGDNVYRNATEQRSGTYCYTLVGDQGDGNWIMQLTSVTPGADYRISIYGKDAAATSSIAFAVLNSVLTKQYNFTTEVWEDLLEPFSPDQTIGATYTEVNEDFNAGEYSSVYVAVKHEPTANETIYVDDFTIKPITYPDPVSVLEMENPSDESKIDDNDSIIMVKTTGGTPKIWFALNGDEEFVTDMAEWNFAEDGAPTIISADYTNTEAAVNSHSAKVLLGKATINVKNTGAVDSDFVMPSGYKLINTEVVTELTAVNALSGDLVFNVGTNAVNYDNIYFEVSPSLSSIGTQRLRNASTAVCSSSGTVKVNVTTADTGTSGTAVVYIFGTLIPTS